MFLASEYDGSAFGEGSSLYCFVRLTHETIILILWTEKTFWSKIIHVWKVNLNYMGRSKALKFKTQKINTIDSFVCIFLFKPIDFIDNNVPNYSHMFSQLCLYSAKWISFYRQVLQIWLLIRWVGKSVVGWSVIGGFNKTLSKHVSIQINPFISISNPFVVFKCN